MEVNIPYDFNRRVQGIFLSDDNGKIYLGHRGRINPYKRESFLNLYNGIVEIVDDGGETTPVVIIADLDNPHFINLLAEFVFEVATIKKTLKESPFTNIEAAYLPTFIPENESRADYTLNNKIEAHLPHAQVTNQLSKLFYNKGFHVSNTPYIDLLIGKDHKPTHIFEVKSKYDSQSIYTAIGQLFLHSLDFNNIIKKVLVLPNGYSTELKQKLDNLGIVIIEFKIINNNVTFYNINKICI